MGFSPPVGANSIPTPLIFAVLVAFPGRPAPFALDLLFSHGNETER